MKIEQYTVSKSGIITNNKTNNIIRGEINNAGYRRVKLAGKRYFVHRLVAEQYIPNPHDKPTVNHKNGNKLDNRVENLEWMTHSENQQHSTQVLGNRKGEKNGNFKHSDETIELVREKIEAGQSRRSIARELKLPQSTVQAIHHKRFR